jgi:hypothetical protein
METFHKKECWFAVSQLSVVKRLPVVKRPPVAEPQHNAVGDKTAYDRRQNQFD